MSVHEDLLNNGENNCSFTEDEVDIMCSEDGDGACGDRGAFKQRKLGLNCFRSSFDSRMGDWVIRERKKKPWLPQ